MTIGKTIVLTIQTFVNKVMSLLFNSLYIFVIVFFQGARIFYLFIYLFIYLLLLNSNTFIASHDFMGNKFGAEFSWAVLLSHVMLIGVI